MVYKVTIKVGTQTFTYDAIGSSAALFDAAYDEFGVCAVSVMRKS